jgi:hypothetical protein
MDALEQLLGLLAKALRDTSSRKESIDEYLRCYPKDQLLIKRSIGQDSYDILTDLFVDLNYFVADPARRAEDPSYYGDERLEREVKTALHRLAELGIAVPKV